MGKFKVTYEKDGVLYTETFEDAGLQWVEAAKERIESSRNYKVKSIEQLDVKKL